MRVSVGELVHHLGTRIPNRINYMTDLGQNKTTLLKLILGNCPTGCTNSFNVFIYLEFSACFEHVRLIIWRNRLYQYSFW